MNAGDTREATVIMSCLIGAMSLLSLHPSGATAADLSTVVPPQAAAVGYITKTFSGTFSKQTVDLDNTEQPGFDWYPWHFFGQALPRTKSVAINADGSIVIGAAGPASSFATAAPTRTSSHWVGVAFGGGAYLEATLKFDPENTAKGKPKDWPAFWSMSIEHLANLDGQQWPGQPPGYVHFIEPDFFEYDVWGFRPRSYYGGAIHESYGIYGTTCAPENFCSVSNRRFTIEAPPETDYRNFHKFGFLWVPATPSTQGYAQYYFDGVATSDRVMWERYTNQPPPPGRALWTFGIIDQQHLVIILGTGAQQPMTVASVSVWQSSAAQNLRQ
jgi:hypothetical protein